jgi:hypothetical protein
MKIGRREWNCYEMVVRGYYGSRLSYRTWFGQTLWESLKAGRSGIRRIKPFQLIMFRCKLVVKFAISTQQYIDRKHDAWNNLTLLLLPQN